MILHLNFTAEMMSTSSLKQKTFNKKFRKLGGVLTALFLVGVIQSEAKEKLVLNQTYTEEELELELNNSETIQMDTFTVIGSKNNVDYLPGSGRFIDNAEITNQVYTDINRVLLSTPGVYVRQEDGYGLFANISLRGVDTGRSAKVTLMEDGILTAPAPYSAPSAYYTPTIGRMRGLEVLKGSSQIKYGPHTTGGVVNYLSTSIPNEKEGHLRTAYGSNNETLVHFDYGKSFNSDSGKFGYLIENYDERSDGFKQIEAATDYAGSDQTGYQKNESMLKLFWEPNTDLEQRLDFKIGYSDFDADETYLGLADADFPGDPFNRYAASRFDNIATHGTRTSLRYSFSPNKDLSIETTAYYQNFHRNWFKLRRIQTETGTKYGLGSALATGGLPLDIIKGTSPGQLDYRNNNRDYYLGGVQSNILYTFNAGEVEHEIEGGIRYHEDRVRRFQQDVSYTQDDTGAITGSTNGPLGGGGNRRQAAKSLSLYAQDTISIGNLRLIPGIRFESIKNEYTDFNTTGQPELITGSGSSTLDYVTPGMGFHYSLSPQTGLFGGIYRGASVPGPRAHAKSDVGLEESIGYEFGLRHRNDNGFHIETTLFKTDFSDLIVVDNIGGSGTGNTENVGDVNAYGLELLIGMDPGVSNQWAFKTPTSIAFTYTSSTLDGDSNSTDAESIFSGGKDGASVPYIPEYQVHFSTGIETGDLGIYLDATYVDSTYSTASNTTAQVNPDGDPDARFGLIDSYFLVDLTAHYRINETVTAFVGAHNLFDDTYIASRHPAGPRPGKSRSFSGGIELNF
ncbi:MAG: TonB-dependent receptor [Opitutaceae bacterium]|nr:TonB-dependent receptor [Opitutaceae bacterium]